MHPQIHTAPCATTQVLHDKHLAIHIPVRTASTPAPCLITLPPYVYRSITSHTNVPSLPERRKIGACAGSYKKQTSTHNLHLHTPSYQICSYLVIHLNSAISFTKVNKMHTPTSLIFSILALLAPSFSQSDPNPGCPDLMGLPNATAVCCPALLSSGPNSPCANGTPAASPFDCTTATDPTGWGCCVDVVRHTNEVVVRASQGTMG
jgi:hypothetical protein